MIYRLLLDQALTVRSTPVLSFAVCFSRRIDDCSGFAGSSVGFTLLFGKSAKKGQVGACRKMSLNN